MTELQYMTLSLLFFVACRVANPASERDREVLKRFEDYLEKFKAKEGGDD